jgi:hypothetical protein
MGLAVSPAAFKTVIKDDPLFDEVHYQSQITESLCISIREAAFRRDELSLRQLRAEFWRNANLLMGNIRAVAPLDGGAL